MFVYFLIDNLTFSDEGITLLCIDVYKKNYLSIQWGCERHSNETLGRVLISSLLQSVSTCIKK